MWCSVCSLRWASSWAALLSPKATFPGITFPHHRTSNRHGDEMDYAAILLAILAACGLILLADQFVLKPRRFARAAGTASAVTSAVSLARTVFPVLLIVLLFRSFLFEPF